MDQLEEEENELMGDGSFWLQFGLDLLNVTFSTAAVYLCADLIRTTRKSLCQSDHAFPLVQTHFSLSLLFSFFSLLLSFYDTAETVFVSSSHENPRCDNLFCSSLRAAILFFNFASALSIIVTVILQSASSYYDKTYKRVQHRATTIALLAQWTSPFYPTVFQLFKQGSLAFGATSVVLAVCYRNPIKNYFQSLIFLFELLLTGLYLALLRYLRTKRRKSASSVILPDPHSLNTVELPLKILLPVLATHLGVFAFHLLLSALGFYFSANQTTFEVPSRSKSSPLQRLLWRTPMYGIVLPLSLHIRQRLFVTAASRLDDVSRKNATIMLILEVNNMKNLAQSWRHDL